MDAVWDWIKENFTDWGLTKIYIACAIAGGTVMLSQFGLSLFGLDGDAVDIDDVDVTEVDAGDASDGLNVLSVRAVSGFLTLFGLVGWAGTSSDWSPVVTAGAALGAGATAMLFVAWMMRMFRRLSESGNVNPGNAIGSDAVVYLRIPAKRDGKGKITVAIQGRSLEYDAVTTGEELPTGAACRVIAIHSGNTFEVEAIR